MARHRFEYIFELKNFSPPSVPSPFAQITWRNPSTADHQILAELMLDSYRNTIDYDGETIEDAKREVESYFSRLEDSDWLNSSWLGFAENNLVCASLVGFWKDRNSPIIAYVMTASSWKGKHLATMAVSRSLQSLAENNHTKVYAVITEGNTPSEKVFARLKFEPVASIQ
ncbi:MAG TPA: GNAT family N-acetyltransferase [Anaerolineales bacterium]|nr:GNAT family N-acetyltransferase [Anaerolineales bacterium]